MEMPRAAWKDIVSRTWQRTWDDNVGLVAAGVAFYGFFALFSLLGLIVLFYGFVADPTTVIDHMRALIGILPTRRRRPHRRSAADRGQGIGRERRVSASCSPSLSRYTAARMALRRSSPR